MASCYVPLHLQSNFSLLRGTVPIDTLVARLKEFGFRAAALADRDNLYGAVFFHIAARETGIRPITGAEVTAAGDARVTLLARSRAGYANICRIVTRRKLDEEFDLVSTVAEDTGGLFLLVGSPCLAEALRPHVVPGSLWMELPLGAGPRALRARREAARRLGIGVVAGGATALGGPHDAPFQRVLAAIRTGGVATEVPPCECATPRGYLRRSEEAASLFREIPEALANTEIIAGACHLDLLADKPVFPHYPLPEGETPYSYLHRLCHEGLRYRYAAAITPGLTARLQRELETIHRMGFPEYFVLVGDLVRFARSRGIPAVGRGSGASSLVAYLLGITSVDPIAHRLYFERFLNALRDDWPDLDVDLCWRGRDEVIEYAYETYGKDKVAMISTHNHYHGRSAFRDVARAFAVPTETVNRVSKRIPRDTAESLLTHFGRSPLLREYPRECEPYRAVLRFADRLRGFPRHLGIHCGGIVIADRPLNRYVPLEEAAKGIVVTQYEMDSIERVGLVKIDLLGNRAISTIRETLAAIRRERGEEVDIDAIAPHDGKTGELLRAGRTLGCFQIESPGMRNLLRMIAASNMGKTIAAHSLIRPGPASSGMKERYIRRARGLEPVTHLHPDLEDLLGDTLGIPLYEEDVMCVASRIAGISLEEGDLLRRRIGEAKDEASMRALTNTFLALAIRRGVDPPLAKKIWSMIARFASYSFCKAHAAGYGILAYQTAYLKAHYPAEHAVSLLNNHQGMYPPRVHLEEARRRGIEVRLPCVNRSGDQFTLEDGAIRVGLSHVGGLAGPVRERIRAGRPFRSLGHFLRRVRPPKRDVENLILVGAFDWIGTRRTELLWELYATYEGKRKTWKRQEGMFPEEGEECVRPPLQDIGLEERLRHEMKILSLAISAHPVTLLRPAEAARGCRDSRVLAKGHPRGTALCLLGIRDAARRVRTKRGDIMLFLTLEDEHDLFECTLFPSVYRRCAEAARGAGPFRVTGTIEEQYGVRTVTVERIESLGREDPLLGDMLAEEGIEKDAPARCRNRWGSACG